MTSTSPRRLAILLSGRGSNFRALADAVSSGRIPETEISAVISDREDAPGLSAAREMRLPAFAVARAPDETRAEHERRVQTILDSAGVDLICLAGYMRVLSAEFVSAYRGRILNIHPSLLPKYPGLDVHRRVLAAGEAESGCTVHYVDAGVDSGKPIVQRRVSVRPGDTEESLAARVLEQEHEAYPEAVNIALSRLLPRRA